MITRVGPFHHHIRDALGTLKVPAVFCDRYARIVALNPAAEALTGWDTQDAASEPVFRVVRLFPSLADRDRYEYGYLVTRIGNKVRVTAADHPVPANGSIGTILLLIPLDEPST